MSLQPNPPYTVPAVSTSGKEWFIYFRFFNAGKWHLIKKREGINRIKDKKKRKIEADGLCAARHDWLKRGWNPVIDPDYKLRSFKSKDSKRSMLLNEALDYALSKKKLKKKSMQDYTNMLDFIKEIANKTGHFSIPITELDRGACLELIDACAEKRKFSNHAYNKYISCLRAMLTVLLDYRVIDINPLHQVKAKPVPESNKYESYTDDEKVEISKYLYEHHYRLYVVMQVVYHTGIRPKEVLALLISDIDLKERVITIAPEDGERENSKTTSVRKVPINPHLFELLEEMSLQKFPGNWLVFGSPFEPGKGNRGAGTKKRFEGIDRPGKEFGTKYISGVNGAMRDDFLTPWPNTVKRDTITKLWKKLIIDGLGIKKHLYAAKHTGTDDKVEAGLDLKDIQFMYGHKSEAMTERYNKKKREMEAKKEIVDKSPAFVIKPKLKAV